MFKKSTIVLSPGRTGSVLLAQNLSRVHYSQGDVLYYKQGITSLDRLRQQRLLVHSHDLFSIKELWGIQVIFSIRRNLHDMLISNYIASARGHWHLPQGQKKLEFSKITVDFNRLDNLINRHLSWHQFYQPQLDNRSVVVIYEMMVDHLNQATVGYQPLYPDKPELVSNWQDTIDYLDQNIPTTLRAAHAAFTDYAVRPSQGIYRSAAGQV